jgi:hypothetical protein
VSKLADGSAHDQALRRANDALAQGRFDLALVAVDDAL